MTPVPRSGAVTADDVAAAANHVVTSHRPATTPLRQLMGAWYDAGLAWIHFPRGLGGLDGPRDLQPIANAILKAAGGPEPRTINPVGFGIVAPTILAFTTPHDAQRYLRPLATGEQIWCQLFSEPGAGSDLAGLATRAIRDDAGWRVTGQKVWTSLAHKASWAVLLARTDPTVPKHEGLTYFVLDMTADGVDVRPLRQLTGRTQFNEVFLDEVYVPDSQRLGDIGAGWAVATKTLADERTSLGDRIAGRGQGAIGDALALWAADPQRHSAVLRARLARLWMRAEAHRLTSNRARVAASRGRPGPQGAITKVVGSELTQDIYEFCMDLLGPEGTLFDTYAPSAPDDASGPTAIQRQFLRSRANTIEGGTSEIMRTVIADRVLGLPPEQRHDKGVPWHEIPR